MQPRHLVLILFAAAIYGIYILYAPFLLSITIAMLLAISTANVVRRLVQITHSPLAAALLSSFLLGTLFFAPLGYFLASITLWLNNIDQATIEQIYRQALAWVSALPPNLEFVKNFLEEFLKQLSLRESAAQAVTYAATIGGYSANFLKTAFLIIVFYFFAQFYGRAIVDFLKQVIHLPQQDTMLLGHELSSVMSVVFYSIIVTAMFEGALFGVAISFMGYNGLLFGIMYGFASLLPVIGGALMWLPFMLYELSLDNTSRAIFIALYSIIIISIVADTFIKPLIIKWINDRLIKTTAKMNELLIFFAIIAGLTTFGFWGMILGPAITAFFLAILKLVERQSQHFDEQQR